MPKTFAVTTSSVRPSRTEASIPAARHASSFTFSEGVPAIAVVIRSVSSATRICSFDGMSDGPAGPPDCVPLWAAAASFMAANAARSVGRDLGAPEGIPSNAPPAIRLRPQRHAANGTGSRTGAAS